MSIQIKLRDRDAVLVLDGDSIAYTGDVLEILDEEEDIIAVFRNWDYAIVQDEEDDDDDNGDDDDEDEDDEEDYDEVEDLGEAVLVVGGLALQSDNGASSFPASSEPLGAAEA